MGNTGSIFYPDNPNRRRRAVQLSNDCQVYKDDYENIKKEIEKELGPYKEKMDDVLNAFGCRNLADLDNLVKATATQEGLKQWEKTKKSVGGLSGTSDMWNTAMGIVAIAGITISTAGALAGGFGFVAGISITSSILAILGAIGLIIDAITGAIERAQLRDAINSLFRLRIQIRYLALQIRQIQTDIPGIKNIYAIFEDAGFNKDQIIQALREGNIMDDFQKDVKKLTHMQVAYDLLHMDEARPGGSWRNEDPSLTAIASSLDALLESENQTDYNEVSPEMRESLESEKRLIRLAEGHGDPIELGPDSVDVIFTSNDTLSPLLQGHITVVLKEVIDDVSATIQLKTADHFILGADSVHQSIGKTTTDDLPDWVMSYPTAAPPSMEQITSLDIRLRADITHSELYLRADGSLDAVGDIFTLSYV